MSDFFTVFGMHAVLTVMCCHVARGHTLGATLTTSAVSQLQGLNAAICS
jgi:hypothetical protein